MSSQSAQDLLRRLKERSEQQPRSLGVSSSLLSTLSFNEPVPATSQRTPLDLLPTQPEEPESGEIDSTVVVIGTKVVLRGQGGCCMSVEAYSPNPIDTIANAQRYRGSACGFGFGAPHECFTFLNRHVRAGGIIPIRYGDRVNIRSHFAREKLLALNTGTSELSFERNLGGKAEDFEVLPAASSSTSRCGFDYVGRETSGSYPQSVEGGRPARGAYLRAGDFIALRSTSGELLAVGDGGKLSAVSEGQLANEALRWQVGVAGTPFLPTWSLTRPFLTGRFLTKPRNALGSRSADAIVGSASTTADVLPLRPLPCVVQEQVMCSMTGAAITTIITHPPIHRDLDQYAFD